ncbi:hypothetical protein BJ508DRAFT_335568 [Ascobolus immersus RN42]|uniref:Uncharacterized protein n=1 Tax=Ascobolus immersus RN42 TaxID=1160509 RepID=A0A3N4HGF2_ASCIM|nr:hypothetical protein BJ508DRAFT_335568 [Ascobolus immersus RN42]
MSQAVIRTARPADLQVDFPANLREWHASNKALEGTDIPLQALEEWIVAIPGGKDEIIQLATQHGITYDPAHPTFNVQLWYKLLSEWIHGMVNRQLMAAHERLDMVVEDFKAREQLHSWAVAALQDRLMAVTKDLQHYAQKVTEMEVEQDGAMDWEPTAAFDLIDFKAYIDKAIEAREFTPRGTRADSQQPPAQPILSKGVHPVNTRRATPSQRRSRSPEFSELRDFPTSSNSRTRQNTPSTEEAAKLEKRLTKLFDRRFEKLYEKMKESFDELQQRATEEKIKQWEAMQATFASSSQLPPAEPSTQGFHKTVATPAEAREQRSERELSEERPGNGHGFGGNGGNRSRGGRRGRPGDDGDSSDSSSSSEDSDSDSEPDVRKNPKAWKRWFKLKEALRKAKKGKRRAASSDVEDVLPARQHHGKVDKVEQFSGENNKYTVEDFLWNLDCKFQIEGKAWERNDQARIRFVSSCLTGKARDWFRAYRYQVNPGEAVRVGMSTQ